MLQHIQGSSDQRVKFLPPVSTGSYPAHLRNKLGKKERDQYLLGIIFLASWGRCIETEPPKLKLYSGPALGAN